MKNALAPGLCAALLLALHVPAARADVTVTSVYTGCRKISVAGATSSPFVAVEVYDTDAGYDLVLGAVPSAGTFKFSVPIPGADPADTLQYWVYGATSPDPTDYDHGALWVNTGMCGGMTGTMKSCVASVGSAWENVLRAQNADDTKCLADAAAGKRAFADCFGSDPNDPRDAVTRAQARVQAAFDAERCFAPPAPPPFALSDPNTTSDSATAAALTSFTMVFGAEPAVADKATQKLASLCQAAAATALEKLSDTYADAANRGRASALATKTSRMPAIVIDSDTFAFFVNASIHADKPLAKALAAVDTALAKACTDDLVDPWFDCGGAASVADLAACLESTAYQATCQAAEAADAIALDCTP